MTSRTDTHRVSEIRPAEYRLVLCYSFAGSTMSAWNLKALHDLTESGVTWFQHPERGSQPGRCDVCGAAFIHGDVWVHDSGQHIHIGQDCAAKYELYAERADWNAAMKNGKASKAAEIEKALRAEQGARILSDNPGLEAALATAGNDFIGDIRGRFETRGFLSAAQIAAVIKAADQIEEPETHVPAPTGRVVVRGRCVSIKLRDSDWGRTLKMTVKVTTEAGTWLAWGTCPVSLFDAQNVENNRLLDQFDAEVDEMDLNEVRTAMATGYKSAARVDLVGSEIEFTATLKTGRDAHFAIFTRPSKASVVNWGEAVRRQAA